jgi:hypothetical protein
MIAISSAIFAFRGAVPKFQRRISVFLEFKFCSDAGELLSGKLGDALAFGVTFGHALAVQLDQFRFVVEEIQLRGGTRLKEVNDSFGARCEVERIDRVMRGGGLHRAGQKVSIKQGGECDGSETAAERPKKWRRVMSRRISWCELMELFLRNGLVEVEQHVGDAGPGGQFELVDVFRASEFAGA